VFEEIANPDLADSDIPSPDAGWGQIGSFALTFNGYEAWDSFDRCGEIANRWAKVYAERQELPDSLKELRTCLFFEQRRWRHFGYDPDDEAMTYIQALVEEILRKVQLGEVE
jgi:hypothetical protein